jgi:hypothetical protein
MTRVSIEVKLGTIDRVILIRALEEAIDVVQTTTIDEETNIETVVSSKDYEVSTVLVVDDKEWVNATQSNCCG